MYQLGGFIFIIFSIFLNGCASHDGLPGNYRSFNATDIPNAIPRIEPKSRYGNPTSYIVRGKRYYVLQSAKCYHAKGLASWYGTMFHERLTSSREPYDMYKMTAANKVLPLPTYVRVKNLDNGKVIIVKVNDRGPFHENRIIDLSFAAAKKMGMISKGTAHVEIWAIDPRNTNESCQPHQPQRSYYRVQVGAFADKSSATRLANKLLNDTKQVINIRRTTDRHQPVYKVEVGKTSSRLEADKIMTQLRLKHYQGLFVNH